MEYLVSRKDMPATFTNFLKNKKAVGLVVGAFPIGLIYEVSALAQLSQFTPAHSEIGRRQESAAGGLRNG